MTREEALREAVLARYTSRYDGLWREIERGLAETDDAFWLMGAANYLFSTGGVRWAVDPMFNTPRNGASLETIGSERAKALLDTMAFVLLTHCHADHFDPKAMALCPDIEWIVPDHLLSRVPETCRNVTVIRAGDVIERRGITIRAFDSLHYDAGTTLGVPETGYLVDTGRFRLLFPTDIRDYDAARLPDMGRVTHFFAHVWLGRGNALNYPCGDYPARMARFILAFKPDKIYLAHLMEAERPPEDLWTYAHAGLVLDAILTEKPEADAEIPMVGKTVRL